MGSRWFRGASHTILAYNKDLMNVWCLYNTKFLALKRPLVSGSYEKRLIDWSLMVILKAFFPILSTSSVAHNVIMLQLLSTHHPWVNFAEKNHHSHVIVLKPTTVFIANQNIAFKCIQIKKGIPCN